MKSNVLIAMVLSAVLTKSKKSYLLTVKTENNENLVIFAPESISNQAVTTTDEKGVATTDDVLRFTTGSCFTFSTVDNKTGDRIFDKDNKPLFELDKDAKPTKVQRVFKTDSTFVLGASIMEKSLFTELISTFKPNE